jgi:hypothetical protein
MYDIYYIAVEQQLCNILIGKADMIKMALAGPPIAPLLKSLDIILDVSLVCRSHSVACDMLD